MYKPILLTLLLAVSSQAQWLNTFQPQGSIEHQCGGVDILSDILSHCDAQGRRSVAKFRDKVTLCHEATHTVNQRITNLVGRESFYLGSGFVAILPTPKIRLSTVAQYVQPNMRDSTYRLYFIEMRRWWENEPLYVLNEWSAYVNGCQTAVELNTNYHGEAQIAGKFSYYADCLVQAIRDNDPGYVGMNDLMEVISFQRSRMAVFAR